MTERSSPSWLTTLGRDSSACLTLFLPSLAWDEWIPRGKSAMLAFFYIVFRQEMGKMGKEKGRSVGTYLSPAYSLLVGSVLSVEGSIKWDWGESEGKAPGDWENLPGPVRRLEGVVIGGYSKH